MRRHRQVDSSERLTKGDLPNDDAHRRLIDDVLAINSTGIIKKYGLSAYDSAVMAVLSRPEAGAKGAKIVNLKAYLTAVAKRFYAEENVREGNRECAAAPDLIDPNDHIARVDWMLDFGSALSDLKPIERQIIEQNVIFGDSMQQIATNLRISLASVYRIRQTALDALHRRLSR